MYLSPVPVADPKEIDARIPEFAERAGYYFANWDRLYDDWMVKVRASSTSSRPMHFSPLPEREDMAVHHRGTRHRKRAATAVQYHRLVDLTLEAVAAPLRVPQPRLRRLPGLLRLLQAAVPVHPGPGDRQDGGRHPGRPVPAGRGAQEAGPARGRARDRRPDQQRPRRPGAGRAGRRPARRQVARRLGGSPRPVVQLLARAPASTTATRYGWSTRTSPFGFLRAYIAQAAAGRDAGPADGGRHAERDRIVDGVHRADRRRRDRATFQAKLGLARTVFPYVENHNFYVEHWGPR